MKTRLIDATPATLPRLEIALSTRIKWRLFRLLEWLSDLRGNATAGPRSLLPAPGERQPALWVFVSTIGELNAIDPFLKKLLGATAALKLVLITDHPHYMESYQRRYPQSFVQVSRGHSYDARQLAERFPPELFVVGEIPCWPGDAPCRFSFAFVIEAKRRGARACIVNAWLYHYPSSCRMDALERYWFQKDYLHAFDRIAAQSEEVKASLIEHGADPVRVQVVGNLKFDAVPPADWTPARARSPRMLGALIDHGRPIIVAGCVTEYDDQHLVLDAFLKIRAQHGEALLIIAPRHPEVVERMHALDGFLQARGLPARFRSRIADEPLSCDIACLVLDTIGELGDFYAASQVAHVGTDHNVLEPLGFGKPVTVQPGWNPTYPSYPVYCLLHEHGGLIQVASVNELAAAWATLLESPESYRQAQAEIGRVLATVRGADDRHWAVVQPLLRAPSR